MKKLLLIAFTIMMSIVINAQQITIFELYNAKVGRYVTDYVNGKFIDTLKWGDVQKCDLIAVVNLSNGTIKINNVSQIVIVLDTVLDTRDNIDKDGDKNTITSFKAVAIDKEGTKDCRVYIRGWDKLGYVQLSVFYDNLVFIYYGSLRTDVDDNEPTTKL